MCRRLARVFRISSSETLGDTWKHVYTAQNVSVIAEIIVDIIKHHSCGTFQI